MAALNRLATAYLQASTWLQAQLPLSTQPNTIVNFRWENVKPSKSLEWTPCFNTSTVCSRLEVPMDWQGHSEEANKIVTLALIKVEASVPLTDSRYGGAIILNPGGPGGSGVYEVKTGGKAVQTLLSAGPGDDEGKHYDIIGFDPRGVNNTRPAVRCYPDHLTHAADSIEQNAFGLSDNPRAFDNLWASKRAMADDCSRRAIENGIGKHMSTATVARDIIEIAERHGEWREREVERLLKGSPQISEVDANAIRDRTAWRPDEEKVQYWGFSYGTVLGATLAAMYPQRISRAVLDGVVDSFDYYAGGWKTNLRDTDRLWGRLYEYCFRTGAANCPVWHKDGPQAIEARIHRILEDLRENPISVPSGPGDAPTSVNYEDFLRVFASDSAYWVLRKLPDLVQILSELEKRNGTGLADNKLAGLLSTLKEPLDPACAKKGPYSDECYSTDYTDWGVTAAIACSDSPGDRLQQTKEEYRAYTEMLMGQSSIEGSRWAEIVMPCTAWRARPAWRYEGDFTAKTKEPILFVGNTIDPVTPLYNAFTMSKGFEGSGILHVDIDGHCTNAGLSLCAARSIREYFQTGKLPGKQGGLEGFDGVGHFCDVDRRPLDADIYKLPDGETDTDLWDAMVALNRDWY